MTTGLVDFLKEAKGNVGLAIATSASQVKVDGILDYLDFRAYFEVIITADQVANGKPDPGIFLKAAASLGVWSAECVVFEDAVNGVKAAKSGGMKCVAITTTHTREELTDAKADMVIDSFSEIHLNDLRNLFENNQ